MNNFEEIYSALKKIRRIERLREISIDWMRYDDREYYKIFPDRIDSLEGLQYRVLEKLIELTKNKTL